MYSKFPVCGLLTCAFLLADCKSLPLKDQADFGLRKVSVQATPEETGQLNGQVQSKRSVRAKIQISGAVTVDCQISFAGRGTLDYYRKSLDLDLCEASYNERHSYRASAQSFDPSMLRAFLAYPVYSALGFDVPEIEFASLYFNRNYMGLYLLSEVVDTEFFRVRGRDTGVIYKARFGNASFKPEYIGRLGDAFTVEGKGNDDYALLRELYELTLENSPDEAYVAKLERLLDIDNFLRYMASTLYACQWDGMHNNYFLVFDRAKGKLTMSPWDMDRTWEGTRVWEPQTIVSLNLILVRLLRTGPARLRLAALLQQLEGEFPLDRLKADVSALAAQSAEAYAADPVLNRRPQAEVQAELVANIELWLRKVRLFRQSLETPL